MSLCSCNIFNFSFQTHADRVKHDTIYTYSLRNNQSTTINTHVKREKIYKLTHKKPLNLYAMHYIS